MSLADLPDVALLTIYANIQNIREKVRLLRVCRRFHEIGEEALRIQAYKIVNKDDYMYQSEIARNPELEEVIVPLNELINLAPKLTHLVDKVYHIGFNRPNEQRNYEVIDLPHTQYLYIDLCQAYFFGQRYKNFFKRKINTFLEKCPQLRTLDVRIDASHMFTIPLSPNLKTFRLSYFCNTMARQPSSETFFGIIDGKAPNLEELSLITSYANQHINLDSIIRRINTNCPNLRYLKLFFQVTSYGRIIYYDDVILGPDVKLQNLEYLDIRGIILTERCWSVLLSVCPNLKFLVFDPETGNEAIRHAVKLHCPRVRIELQRPFEVEEEFRVYNYKKLSSDAGRFL